MKIYIDNDYKCHVSNDGTMREFDASFFDGKCAAFVEGYRYVPAGESWRWRALRTSSGSSYGSGFR